jgi:hypothetical protein
MSNNRTQLALAADEGLTDQELAERGTAGFKKMIARKRFYSKVANEVAEANKKLKAELTAVRAQLELTAKNYDALLATLHPEDVTQAGALLEGIFKKEG